MVNRVYIYVYTLANAYYMNATVYIYREQAETMEQTD